MLMKTERFPFFRPPMTCSPLVAEPFPVGCGWVDSSLVTGHWRRAEGKNGERPPFPASVFSFPEAAFSCNHLNGCKFNKFCRVGLRHTFPRSEIRDSQR